METAAVIHPPHERPIPEGAVPADSEILPLLDWHLRMTFGVRPRPGRFDCAIFVAEWADLVSGSSHAAALRGTYDTHFAGLRRHASSGLSAAIAAALTAAGWSEVTMPWAVGDICLTDCDWPCIWRGKSAVGALHNASGHAYIHSRHILSALRRPQTPV